MRIDSRELLAVGIFGDKSRGFKSNLGDRIEMLLRRGRTFSPQTSAAEVFATAVVLGGLTLAGSLAPRWIAFAQPAPRPSFEVASIKLNTSRPPMSMIYATPGSPRFAATNVSLRALIVFAYHLKSFEISGVSGVIDADRYDIEAKAAEASPSDEQTRHMAQALLADRFKLMVHRETKETPIYALVAGKGGIKLTEPKEGGCVPFDPGSPAPMPSPTPGQPARAFCGRFFVGPNSLRGGGISTKEFADGLSTILGRPVVDKTGYTGTFDAALEYSQEGVDTVGFSRAPFIVGKPPDDDSRPSIFTVLQDRLGLKLESQKGSAEILVIDHAEKPDAN